MNPHNERDLTAEQLWALSKELCRADDDSERSLIGLKVQVAELIDLLRRAMWPKIFGPASSSREPSLILVGNRLERAFSLLVLLIRQTDPARENAEDVAREYLGTLPSIKKVLATDVQAAYEGDPAARSPREIMLSYPSFEAVSIYRLAHCLYEMQIPLIPRMMTEYAHQLTGIDIHPGASIGPYFFIDHGSGVVIGETCTIGEHVKLYQGVTLGARSFSLDENGNPIKGIKRHPDIGDRVVIYSGATILGGSTVIGDGCVIGGNVWLTHSVPAGQKVIAKQDLCPEN